MNEIIIEGKGGKIEMYFVKYFEENNSFFHPSFGFSNPTHFTQRSYICFSARTKSSWKRRRRQWTHKRVVHVREETLSLPPSLPPSTATKHRKRTTNASTSQLCWDLIKYQGNSLWGITLFIMATAMLLWNLRQLMKCMWGLLLRTKGYVCVSY